MMKTSDSGKPGYKKEGSGGWRYIYSIHAEICNIYPPELTLKKTTESDVMLSYLDIEIRIDCGKYIHM